ncbi:fibronectin type III domain-containing protein [Butyrivibrio sp. WCD2001]|uniref:fibronectin type III domain-containing protein n=1 Tax=Butyrivibrio sp. WCD2001 TaxID=1280681 RepID=UPI00040595D0|nr:fibronectin type III domain-containing protein [Butyrivibrio sp. WCD2001]
MKKRFLTGLLTVVMSTALVVMQPVSVYAAPSPISKEIFVDPVTYYKVDTNQFSKSQVDFYRDMLTTHRNQWPSPKQKWNKIAGAILRQKNNLKDGDSGRLNSAISAMSGTGHILDDDGSSNTDHCSTIPFQEAGSLQQMEKDLLSGLNYSGSVIDMCGLFKDGESLNSGPVFYQGGMSWENDGKAYMVVAVLFSDFKVTPILPDADPAKGNFVETTVSDVTSEGGELNSQLINRAADRTLDASQTIGKDSVVTIRTEVTGSKEYSISETLTVGAEYGFTGAFKGSVEVSVGASQVFHKSLTEGQDTSKTFHTDNTISAGLPPFTGGMLKQVYGTQQVETTYNCPVALTYRVRVLQYRAGYEKNAKKLLDAQSYERADFGKDNGGDARKDLYNRAVINKNNNVDPDGIHWNNMPESILTANRIYERAATEVPMASTPATFIATLKTTSGELKGIAPLYPLKYVRLENKALNELEMKTGDTYRVDLIELEGLAENEERLKGPYYGFDKSFGKWILTDKNHKELTDGSVATLTKNERTGAVTLKAVSEGMVYLEYLIDENRYSTFTDGSRYATNKNLKEFPSIEVKITSAPVTAEKDADQNEAGNNGQEQSASTPDQNQQTTPSPAVDQVQSENTTPPVVLEKTDTVDKKLKKTSLSKLKAGKKSITITWKKNDEKGIKGYEIQYSTNKKFNEDSKKVTINKNKTTSKTIKKLEPKKTYYVRIRSFKKSGGEKIYSKWSKTKSIKVK